MRYVSLASGSKGNCHACSDGARTLLVDAGLNLKQLKARLEGVDLPYASIGAVALTHEHSDHIGAVGVMLRRTDWVFVMTAATKRAVEAIHGLEIPSSRWIRAEAGHAVGWEGFDLRPFSLPHDAEDPVAWRLERGGVSMAIATDLGHPTALVADHCRDLDLLVLEANHDVDMLREGSYPPSLKARILSRVGHLSNVAMAELLQSVLSPRLKAVVLAHLSEQNNDPLLAQAAARLALGSHGAALHLATQREPLPLSIAVAS